MGYDESEYLQLSGLQHFAFCRRQWALIHIECLWEENLRTTEGALLHERAHDNSIREARGDAVTVRGVSVRSAALGVSGQCDAVEYRRDRRGVAIAGMEGLRLPYPVEYKRGKPKIGDEDRLQLCGQAMCLEEMLCCDIPQGALFYGEPRRREVVDFTDALRAEVRKALAEMRELFRRGHTPKVKPSKACNACSLKELCLPKLMRARSVSDYLDAATRGEPT